MNEKRYVVKSGDGYYYRAGGWSGDIKTAHIFEGIGALLLERDWTTLNSPSVIEVELVPQPEWREVREL